MDMRPAIPVVASEEAAVWVEDGVPYQDLELVYTDYDIGRFREGYCCIRCGEAQERPFPLSCSGCGFAMKTEQSMWFAAQFAPNATIGPSRSLEDLRAEDEEAKERTRRITEGNPTSMIWVP